MKSQCGKLEFVSNIPIKSVFIDFDFSPDGNNKRKNEGKKSCMSFFHSYSYIFWSLCVWLSK